ncbi:MAG: hypothetical protein HY819_10800 [Acidobacteria bacterium]|nr:hypothetical protein [Acidobacteriota bacterium]
MLRLILHSVELSESSGQTQAIVTLQNGDKHLVGSARRLPDNDDFIIVAQATLDAVSQSLSQDIKLELNKAAPIKHDSIDKNILVVTVDYTKDGQTSQLTGTCLSTDDAMVHNIAKATLDATNRLIAYLSELENIEN